MAQSCLYNGFVAILGSNDKDCVAGFVAGIRIYTVVENGFQLGKTVVPSQRENIHRGDIHIDVLFSTHVLCKIPLTRPAYEVPYRLVLATRIISGIATTRVKPVIEHGIQACHPTSCRLFSYSCFLGLLGEHYVPLRI